jgi:hypothetical protein
MATIHEPMPGQGACHAKLSLARPFLTCLVLQHLTTDPSYSRNRLQRVMKAQEKTRLPAGQGAVKEQEDRGSGREEREGNEETKGGC